MIGSIITYFLLLNECADEKRSGYDRKKKYVGKPHWIEYVIIVVGAVILITRLVG